MTRTVVSILAALALFGCNQRQPRMSEAEIQRIHREEPGLTDKCLDQMRWGGVEALTGDIQDCYKFDPPRYWKGLTFSALEESRFCPEPAYQCSYDSPGEKIWLDPGPSVQIPAYNGEDAPVRFAVEFIGRKTSYPGHYGHLGGSDQWVIMDRLISMKRLKPAEK